MASIELSDKQRDRLGLEASASLLRDILIGNTSKIPIDMERQRHSLHGVPEHWYHNLPEKSREYSEPYSENECDKSLPEHSHYCDGYIHVGKDFMEKRQRERGTLDDVKGPSNRQQFLSIPPLSFSTPPPKRKGQSGGGGAPYYVGDTIGHGGAKCGRRDERGDLSLSPVRNGTNASSKAANFPPGLAPNAGRELVVGLGRPDSVTNNSNNNDNNNGGSGPAKGSKTFFHVGGPIPRQHPCCQCECHSSSEHHRSNHKHRILRRRSTSRQGRSSSAAALVTSKKSAEDAGDANLTGLQRPGMPTTSHEASNSAAQRRSVSASNGATAPTNNHLNPYYDHNHHHYHHHHHHHHHPTVAQKDGQFSKTSRSGGEQAKVPELQSLQLVDPKLDSHGQNNENNSKLDKIVPEHQACLNRHLGESSLDGESPGKYEAVKRRNKVGRSPTQKLLNRSAMVLDNPRSPVWNGVSGVPGLGVSIPQRPRSACEFDQEVEWYSAPAKFELLNAARKFAEKAVNKTKKKTSLTTDTNSLNPHESSSASHPPNWAPHSLQSISHLKLGLPRIKSSGESSRSSDGSQTYYGGSHEPPPAHKPNPSANLKSKKASFRAPSNETGLRDKKHPPSSHLSSHRPLHHSVSQAVQKSQHPSLNYTKSLAVPASEVHGERRHKQVPPHVPLKRTQQRKTVHRDHFEGDDQRARPLSQSNLERLNEHKRLSLNNRQHSSDVGFMQSEPYNPISLPLYGNEIPRAPIPIPVSRNNSSSSSSSSSSTSSSSSEDEEGSSIVHYEVLEGRGGKISADHESLESLEKPHFVISDPRRPSMLSHPSANANHERSPVMDSSFGSGGGHDSTFDSVELPPLLARSAQHYKVLNDRDGDYSYAYDCSLSPAFLIRYNEDRAPSRRNSDGENIYEEILEVKKLIADQFSKKRVESDEKLSGGSASSTKSSVNADSGVGLNPRKFSNDTLDFGPRNNSGRRHISRYSHDSSDSFGVSDSSDDNPLKSMESVDHHAWMKPSNHHPLIQSTSRSFPTRNRSQEALHRQRQSLVHGSPSPNGDKDSGIQDIEAQDKKSSISKIKGLKFGFGQTRSKTSINLLGPAHSRLAMSKRSESIDNRIQDLKNEGVNATNKNSFIKRCLSKFPSISKEGPISSLNNRAGSLKSSSSLDNISFSDEEPGNMQRFQRSRITSRWENIDEDDD
ncbi:uncharacterized protein LOC131881859 [Tigriopus californicus]|uniref:uncharacterized protein LOC131881859 n=1 Tax=Tigriopus californicus TaxID=6832 RepID=UPI0027DA2700|nr:uncharacterized protein LOC131881859 [Tigriopus californicus]